MIGQGNSDEQPMDLPHTLADAERFQRLFVKPMVDAVRQELQPVIQGMADQALKDKEQDGKIQALESGQKKAMVGWGVIATGLSIALVSCWEWAFKKVKGS